MFYLGKEDIRKEITISVLGCKVPAARCLHQAFSHYSVLEMNYTEVCGISLQEWEEMYVVRFHVYFIMLFNSLNSLVCSSLDNFRRSIAFSFYATFVHKWQQALCHRYRLKRSTSCAVLRSFILEALLQNCLGLQPFRYICAKYLYPKTNLFLKEIIIKLGIPF